jgi:hypothetical protein
MKSSKTLPIKVMLSAYLPHWLNIIFFPLFRHLPLREKDPSEVYSLANFLAIIPFFASLFPTPKYCLLNQGTFSLMG